VRSGPPTPRPIPTLAPNGGHIVFFDSFPDYIKAGLPMHYDVTVHHRDTAGKSYRESTALDLDVFLGTGGITRHDLHDIHQRLKEIARDIHHWTDTGGIKTLSRRDLRERNAARARARSEGPTTDGQLEAD
jgi:hypothetical protein